MSIKELGVKMKQDENVLEINVTDAWEKTHEAEKWNGEVVLELTVQ